MKSTFHFTVFSGVFIVGKDNRFQRISTSVYGLYVKNLGDRKSVEILGFEVKSFM